MHRGKFTWVGNRYKHTIRAKNDIALANADCPRAYVEDLNWNRSDHYPLLLHAEGKRCKGVKLFKYDNRWRFNEELRCEIQKVWDEECKSIPPENLNIALNNCRNRMAKWKSLTSHNSQKRIQELKASLHQADDSPTLDFHYIHELKVELNYQYRMEEEFCRTKSRIQWLKAGNRNMKFFHEKTKQRRSLIE